MKEPIRIISDLHYGHPMSYVHDPRQLTPLLEGIGTLILNGDSVEMRFPGEQTLSLQRAKELRDLCHAHGVEPILLNGNHDPAVSDLNHVDLQNGRVLVMHGDGLFPNISPWSPRAGQIGKAVQSELASLGPNPVMEDRLIAFKRAVMSVALPKPLAKRSRRGRLVGILRDMWPPRRPWIILKTWMETSHRASEFAERHRPDAEVVIIGHIHAPTVRKVRHRLVINTGCFMPPLWRYCVDVTGADLTVRRVHRRADDLFVPGGRTIKPTGAGPRNLETYSTGG